MRWPPTEHAGSAVHATCRAAVAAPARACWARGCRPKRERGGGGMGERRHSASRFALRRRPCNRTGAFARRVRRTHPRLATRTALAPTQFRDTRWFSCSSMSPEAAGREGRRRSGHGPWMRLSQGLCRPPTATQRVRVACRRRVACRVMVSGQTRRDYTHARATACSAAAARPSSPELFQKPKNEAPGGRAGSWQDTVLAAGSAIFFV